MAGAQRGTSCRSPFKQLQILPVPCQYMLSLMSLIISNQEIYQANSSIHSINPLTPELNPSNLHCLPELFTGDFKF